MLILAVLTCGSDFFIFLVCHWYPPSFFLTVVQHSNMFMYHGLFNYLLCLDIQVILNGAINLLTYIYVFVLLEVYIQDIFLEVGLVA